MAKFKINGGLAAAGLGGLLMVGCVGPFPLGYRTGSADSELRQVGVRAASPGHEQEQLLERTTDKLANLLLTPEGPRSGYSVGSSYRYFFQTGPGAPAELKFLRFSDAGSNSGMMTVGFPLAGSREWVGVRTLLYDDGMDFRHEPSQGHPHNFPHGRYEALVFTPEKIVRRFEIDAVAYAAHLSVPDGSRSLRFWRNDGWWLRDLDSGTEAPESNRLAEVAPSHHGVAIPGTSQRIFFELPAFTDQEESLGNEQYTFAATTAGRLGANEWSPDNLVVRILHGWHWSRDVRTRDGLIKYHYDHPPTDLPRTDQYIKIERQIAGSAGYPDRKELTYVSDLGEWPLEILLVVSAPFERWTEVIAHFEATLRIESVRPTGVN